VSARPSHTGSSAAWLGAGLAAWLTLGLGPGCGARSELDAPVFEIDASPARERCNGLDDDGDGAIDEDLGALSCGVGACLREVPACVEGVPGACVPGEPTEELCNGLDDDCDGAVDEGLGLVRVAGPTFVASGLTYLARSALAPTPDGGFWGLYATSFNGSAPVPNVFRVRLDASGAPTSEPAVLTERNMTQGPRVAPFPGGFLVSYCGRWGANDRATSGALGLDGVFVEHGQRSPMGLSCGAGDPDAIWTGERMLFSWATNSSPYDVLVDVADAAGASVGGGGLDDGSDLFAMPRFATTPQGRTLLAYSRQDEPGTSLLRVRRLDAAGTDAKAPLTLPHPLELGTWSEVSLAAQPGRGFLLLSPNRFEKGWIRARFDDDGEPLGPPEQVPGFDVQLSIASTLVARPGAGYVATGDASFEPEPYSFVVTLDDEGDPQDVWSTALDPVEPIVGFPALASSGGRIVMLYTSWSTNDPDHPELRSMVLGCAP
jgi:hypothetical protein